MTQHAHKLYLLLLVLFLAACAGATPRDTTQTLYAAGWTLVGAANSVADLHDAGTLKADDYENAKQILAQATTAYQSARTALRDGRPTDALGYIRIAQGLLNQLAAYLAAKEAS